MAASVQDVWLRVVGQQADGGGWVDTSGGGELDAEKNEKAGCSKDLHISRCHSARHLSRI